jgi:hypothetical protein
MAIDEIDGRLDDLAAGLAPRRGAGPGPAPGEISLR